MNTKTNEEILNLNKWEEETLKAVEIVVKKIQSADPKDPEALALWNSIKDLDYILPEVREKWEKALKKELN